MVEELPFWMGTSITGADADNPWAHRRSPHEVKQVLKVDPVNLTPRLFRNGEKSLLKVSWLEMRQIFRFYLTCHPGDLSADSGKLQI